jgi:hypothetical protein
VTRLTVPVTWGCRRRRIAWDQATPVAIGGRSRARCRMACAVPASTRTGHCRSRSRPVDHTGHGRSLRRTPSRTGWPPTACDGHHGRPPAAAVVPGRHVGSSTARPSCAGQPAQAAQDGRTPASDRRGHRIRLPDNRSPGTPGAAAARGPRQGAAALRRPYRPDSGLPAVSAAITTRTAVSVPSGASPSGSRGSAATPPPSGSAAPTAESGAA